MVDHLPFHELLLSILFWLCLTSYSSNSHFDLSAGVRRESNFEPVEHKIEEVGPTGKTDIAGERTQIIKEGFAAHQGLS